MLSGFNLYPLLFFTGCPSKHAVLSISRYVQCLSICLSDVRPVLFPGLSLVEILASSAHTISESEYIIFNSKDGNSDGVKRLFFLYGNNSNCIPKQIFLNHKMNLTHLYVKPKNVEKIKYN